VNDRHNSVADDDLHCACRASHSSAATGPPSRRWPVSRPGESLQAWTPCTALPRPSAWSWSSTFVSGHLPDEQRRRDEIGT